MSDPMDKLPAFAGIAHYFETRQGRTDTYVAGIWQDMPYALLWWCPGDQSECDGEQRLNHWRAPTWSWACLDCEIECFWCRPTKKDVILSTIERFEYVADGPDSFGRLHSASMFLRGPAFSDTVTYSTDSKTDWVTFRLASLEPEWHRSAYPDFDVVKSNETVQVGVQCVVIMRLEFRGAVGLLLMPSKRVPGAFERVGVFNCPQSHIEEQGCTETCFTVV